MEAKEKQIPSGIVIFGGGFLAIFGVLLFYSCIQGASQQYKSVVAESAKKERAMKKAEKAMLASITPEQMDSMRQVCIGLLDQGLVHKYHVSSDFIEMQVTPLFMNLALDDKRNIVNVVYRFSKANDAPDATFVSLVDYRSGKSVGSYDPNGYGLMMSK